MLAPNNIATHIGQNLVNFMASNIAWIILGSFYSVQNSNSARSVDPIPAHFVAYPPLSRSSLENLTADEKEALLQMAKNSPDAFKRWFHRNYDYGKKA